MTTIKINGRPTTVLNTYSDGPGTPVHTMDIFGGWLRKVPGGKWRLHRPGCWPVDVSISLA